MQKMFLFAPFQFVALCIFELHKDWSMIIPVKALVRDVSGLYSFWIWDAYFHIRITGVTVTSGITDKHRTNFGEKFEVTAFPIFLDKLPKRLLHTDL